MVFYRLVKYQRVKRGNILYLPSIWALTNYGIAYQRCLIWDDWEHPIFECIFLDTRNPQVMLSPMQATFVISFGK